MKLYRATNRKSDSKRIPAGSCWTTDEKSAQMYRDNPGYGGKHLVSVEVEIGNALDLRGSSWDRDDWQALADALGYDGVRDMREALADQMDGDYIEDYLDDAGVRGKLADAGYDWVIYHDTYPEGCVTYRKM